jgi:NADH-quinone oxidoreductase subunit D
MTNNLCLLPGRRKAARARDSRRPSGCASCFNELTRLNSHLVWLGTHAMDIGALTVFLYCFREREDILRIFEPSAASA